MRILHFADAHLGRDDWGPINPGTGLSARLGDYVGSLTEIVRAVDNRNVDLVVFTGDAFHSAHPTMTAMRAWARFLCSISASAIPLVWIVGNHGVPGSWGRAHTADPFAALNLERVYIVDRPQLISVETRAGAAQVVGIPYPSRHNVMASGKVDGLPKGAINRLISDALVETIQRLARQLDPSCVSILAAHLSVDGGDMGGGTPVGLGDEISLPLEAVALPQFDYVALGHLHKHQSLNDNPPMIYSGSIERNDFGEENEERGFMVVDVGREGDQAITRTEFVPLAARQFTTIQVTLDGSDPTAAVLEAMEGREIEDAVVRVIVEGTPAQAALLDEGRINRALAPALRGNIIKRIERETRTRLGDVAYEEMAPLDLLRAYLSSNGRAPEECETLMTAAEELMKEETA